MYRTDLMLSRLIGNLKSHMDDYRVYQDSGQSPT